LAFERHDDPTKAYSAIRKFREDLEVPYPILFAGPADKEKASQVLPMLNRIISYPTLLFLDAQNRVKKIHTGFTGPATSKYQQFEEDFETAISNLIP
jgi:hypothetical protein